jgi:hypothetical protein
VSSITAQLLDELGYDPADGRVALDELTDVPVGAVVAARDGARPVAVARLASGKLVVVADECPHDGGRISDGFVDGERLTGSGSGSEIVGLHRAGSRAHWKPEALPRPVSSRSSPGRALMNACCAGFASPRRRRWSCR